MKIAIPLQEESRQGLIAEHFARAKYFAVIDNENKMLELVPNPCLGMSTQAGKCSLLYLISRKTVDSIIAYELGHKVQQIANENNIRLILINRKYTKLNQMLKLMDFNINE